MNVQIVKFPGKVHDFEIEEGSTLNQLIDIAKEYNPDIDFNGEARVNNSAITGETRLFSGQKVIITKMLKGNQISIMVIKFPGAKAEVMLDHGATIAMAIEAAKSTIGDVEGYDIQLNNVNAQSTDLIPDNGSVQRIILTKKIKGN